jgi:hypothetical protein
MKTSITKKFENVLALRVDVLRKQLSKFTISKDNYSLIELQFSDIDDRFSNHGTKEERRFADEQHSKTTKVRY